MTEIFETVTKKEEVPSNSTSLDFSAIIERINGLESKVDEIISRFKNRENEKKEKVEEKVEEKTETGGREEETEEIREKEEE